MCVFGGISRLQFSHARGIAPEMAVFYVSHSFRQTSQQIAMTFSTYFHGPHRMDIIGIKRLISLAAGVIVLKLVGL